MTTLKAEPVATPLATLGAAPAFPVPLHVGRPVMPDREGFLAEVGEILDRRWFTNNGPVVQEFERRLAEYVGVRHCVASFNATVALGLAIRAIGLRGEVILPAYNFVAGAHAQQRRGSTPVFADIDPITHSLDPVTVEPLITPATARTAARRECPRGVLFARPRKVA